MEVSERECALRMKIPAREETGIRWVRRSTIRIRGVMKKGFPEE